MPLRLACELGKRKPRSPKGRPRLRAAEKKVLVEDTPALDTYEARQRGRLIIGGLIASCFGIFGWIFYSLFIYDPNPIMVTSGDEPPPPAAVLPPPKKDLDPEAHGMFVRALDFAKAGHTDQAVSLLKTLVKSYPDTRTAGEASKALAAQAEPSSVPGSAGHAGRKRPEASSPCSWTHAGRERPAEANDRQCHVDVAGQSGRGDAGSTHRSGDEHRNPGYTQNAHNPPLCPPDSWPGPMPESIVPAGRWPSSGTATALPWCLSREELSPWATTMAPRRKPPPTRSHCPPITLINTR